MTMARSARLSKSGAPRRTVARDLALSVYLPTFIAEIGIGATLPLFALSALAVGEPAAVASLAVTLYSGGRMIGSAWGGSFASHRGAIPATLVSYGVLAGGAVVCALADTVVLLTLGVLLIGIGHAGVHVARQAHVDALAQPGTRARVLSTMAGTWRLGNFIGPFAGAVLIHRYGLESAYVFAAVTVVLGVAVLAVTAPRHLRIPKDSRQRFTMRAVLGPQLKVLSTLGMGVLLFGAIRQARVAIIPLWAAHVGMSESTISVVFGISTVVDMAMFIPAGYIMDRWGRVWTAVPAALVMTVGAVALPFTHGFAQVAAASFLLGLGNGWGTGIIMTLGADAAPEQGRAVFLGAWSILQDVGGALGPAVVAAGAAIAFPVGFFAVGGVGLSSAGVFYRFVPRDSHTT
jgi:MFS family permease